MIDEKEGERKTLFGNKLFFILPAIIIVGALLILIFYFSGSGEIDKFFSCGDGTPSGSCSDNKPYFCDKGELVEKAGFCSCQNSMVPEGDSCVSEYAIGPREITLKYVLGGREKEIDFILHKGMADYISGLPRTINSNGGGQPTRQDFKLKDINEPEQREFLLPLVIEIQNTAKDKIDQVRIATSLVQEIPFGASSKTISVGGPEIGYARYPYEVLYDNKGVCGEKSELLAFLLKELGFETVIFYYRIENHEAVGVRCPLQYSMNRGGYCFIETSAPSIISNFRLEYIGGLELFSTPEIISISKGDSLGGGLGEYKDAQEFSRIEIKIEEAGEIGFFENLKFKKIKEKYGLADEYNI
ncbi:MAG: hypothetical protein PVJ67_04865 [Candidatus Pacearchaeota archaeon]|jgi:hypothetical protein